MVTLRRVGMSMVEVAAREVAMLFASVMFFSLSLGFAAVLLGVTLNDARDAIVAALRMTPRSGWRPAPPATRVVGIRRTATRQPAAHPQWRAAA